LRKGNIIYTLITAAIFILLEIAALSMLNNNGPLQKSWFGKAGQGFMEWIWGGTQKISGYFSLSRQNAELAAENSRLTILLAQQKDSLFRDTLDRMVVKDNKVGNFTYIPAGISKTKNNSQHNFMILDKGSADGVREGDGVITAKGAIGIVDAVSEHFSFARSFKNNQMSISARLGKEGLVGTMSWDGRSRNKALLREIPHHIVLTPGDTVYTSGYSSIFPPEIPLGTTGEAKIVNGSTYEIVVTLFEDLNSLRYAIIVGNHNDEEITTLETQEQ
jgi:rod shape-determining protein MreC